VVADPGEHLGGMPIRGKDGVEDVLDRRPVEHEGQTLVQALGPAAVPGHGLSGERGQLEEAQLLRLDSAGLIREITLFLRPLPALTGLVSTLGPALARQQDHPGLARFLADSNAPFHVLTRLGEHHVVPLAAPPATTPDPT